MRICVLALFLVGLGGRCLAQEGGQGSEEEVTEMFGDQGTCSQYCDGTYPEHTYPDPDDHSACARGCRLAQMDALIAWPFRPDPASCHDTCKEAYSSSRPLFACRLGCNVTTIDQKVPNRDHIYPMQTNTSEVGLIMEVLGMIREQLPQFVVVDDDLAQLTQHAQRLFQLLPCGVASSVVLIEDDGDSVEIQYRYSLDYFPLSSPGDQTSDYLSEPRDEPYNPETSAYHISCPWKTVRYTMTGRLLFFVALVLIAVALFTCCCASFMPEDEGEGGGVKKNMECRHSRVEPSSEKVYIATTMKSPVTFAPGYPQPVPYYGEKKSTRF